MTANLLCSSAVVLLDRSAMPCGVASKDQAHRPPGLAHLAFSVVLRDSNARMLVQQRAREAHHFPLRWSNSCCSHPGPGESVRAAARRRLGEELGLDPTPGLAIHDAFWYRATDPVTGLVEIEYDVVVTGVLDRAARLAPDPREVRNVRWVEPDALRQLLTRRPSVVTPWFANVVASLDHAPRPIAPGVPT